jgi:TolB-like protein
MKPHAALALTLFLSLGTIALAGMPDALTVAVYNFTGEAEAASYGSKVTALVTADLATETNLIMVERSELNKALNEQAFDNTGMVGADAAAKMGQISGAKVLVTGQIIKTEENHLVLIANIVGTETARLFAAKVEGPANDLLALTSDLSAKIAQTIVIQTTNLIAETPESSAARLNRIVKSVQGTNRPTVSERKPDVVITGVVVVDGSHRRGGIHTEHAVVVVKVQERRTGTLIAVDRQESAATDATQVGAQRSAQALAVDELAARFLPLLAR